MFIFDRLSTHFQKKKFLKRVWNLNSVLQIIENFPSEYSPENTVHECLLVDPVLWPNNLRFNRYIPNCTLPRVPIFIIMLQEKLKAKKQWKFQICCILYLSPLIVTFLLVTNVDWVTVKLVTVAAFLSLSVWKTDKLFT